jgi:hypothetical protein
VRSVEDLCDVVAQRNEPQLTRRGDETLQVGDRLVVAGRTLEAGLLGRRDPTVCRRERQRETLPLPRDLRRKDGLDLANPAPGGNEEEEAETRARGAGTCFGAIMVSFFEAGAGFSPGSPSGLFNLNPLGS